MLMDLDWISNLAAVAVRAPSADNSQPWALRWDGNELSIDFALRDKTRSLFPADSHATLLSVGAVTEHVQAALITNGIAANWQFPVRVDLGLPYAAITIQNTSQDFVFPQGLLQRHTNRFAFRSSPLPTNLLEEIGSYSGDCSRLSLFTAQREKSKLADLIRTCSEARFCHHELHEWLIGSLRFTQEEVARGDGLDIRTLALPLGGKEFFRFISDWNRLETLNRLGAYKLLARSEAVLPAAAPAIICIVGRTDALSVIDAGRLMTRVWVDLNLKGIAVHPYYVVTDQVIRMRNKKITVGFEARITKVDEEIHEMLGIRPDEMLHMIMRIGYPRVNPVRSTRMPLKFLFDDRSKVSRGS
jgi:hypothetical protein